MSDKPESTKFEVVCKAAGTRLGIIFGYGMVCRTKGADGAWSNYVDFQSDHIGEDTMLRGSTNFMVKSRALKAMHEGQVLGEVVHSLPVTEEIAAMLELDVKKTGWIVGVKPADPADVAKFDSGEYTGFSIGGRAMSRKVTP